MESNKRPNGYRGRAGADILRRPVTPRPVAPAAQSVAPTAPPETAHGRRFLSGKKIIILAAILVAICLAVFLIHAFTGGSPTSATKPSYKTVLPKGKSIKELGGWKRVSPPKNDPVFAYLDTIDGVPVSVSQQPLPRSFESDTNNQVAELAKKFNATDTINAGGATAYVGTSSKGPQSVIFTSGDLLILIKSEKKISDASWAKYAESLK